jgi:hypothetical protein
LEKTQAGFQASEEKDRQISHFLDGFGQFPPARTSLFVKCIIPFKTGIAGWCAKNAFPPRCDWNRDEAIIKSCS